MDFPSNSKQPRPAPDEKPRTIPGEQPPVEDKKIEPVVEGIATRRKKPLGKRFIESFFSGETPKSVLGYVAVEVLIPAAKDMIRDAGQEALDRFLYRNGGGSSSSRRSRTSPYTPYDRYASSRTTVRREDPRERERPGLSSRARATHDFDEIVIPTRAEANEIIDRMFDLLKRYEQVTVAEFYQLTNNTPNYTDENWGWTDLRGVEPKKVRDGFIVDLPRPEHLK